MYTSAYIWLFIRTTDADFFQWLKCSDTMGSDRAWTKCSQLPVNWTQVEGAQQFMGSGTLGDWVFLHLKKHWKVLTPLIIVNVVHSDTHTST